MFNNSNKPEFSFIIPNYNAADQLIECLESIRNQDLDSSFYEVVLVDDCSSDKRTCEILQQIQDKVIFEDMPLILLINPQNKWAAETRNIGSRIAKGDYFVFLDSDDTIEPDFLRLAKLTFAAYPNASWVYPSVRKFGYKNQTDIAPDFSAKNLFLENYLVVSSPMKRRLWEKLGGHRCSEIDSHIKLYEDWDFWQRAVGIGAFGAPIKKSIFNYRQQVKSLMTRTENYGNLTVLLSYRKNWKTLFGIRGAQGRFDKDNHAFEKIDGLSSKVLKYLIKKTLKRTPSKVSIKEFLLFLFAPHQFIARKLNPTTLFTKAHKMAGFSSGFDIFKLPVIHEAPVKVSENKVLCTHFWWHLGGAENILLDFMTAFYQKNWEVIDCVFTGKDNGKTLKDRFKTFSNRQLDLQDVGQGPYPKLLALWALIQQEKPAVILNMSNPLLYILTPIIKKILPETRIYDLLHCEDYDDNGWFEAAFYFQKHIDVRVVTSEFWKDVLIKKYSEIPEKIEVIYNMIAYENLKQLSNVDKQQQLLKYKLPVDKKMIGFLGRFHEQKRPDIFVALAKSLESDTSFHFVMAGDGPLLEGLMPEIRKLSNLTYLGSTRNPEKILPLFDVAIFPSKYEGYPLVGIECAFLNIPIIAAHIIGFKEQIENGNFGLLYDVRSKEEDTTAIKNLLLEEFEKLNELGVNGSAFVAAYHNKEKIIASIHHTFKL
jgi:glycosyltransferase involved in cell wall biosynthesis